MDDCLPTWITESIPGIPWPFRERNMTFRILFSHSSGQEDKGIQASIVSILFHEAIFNWVASLHILRRKKGRRSRMRAGARKVLSPYIPPCLGWVRGFGGQQYLKIDGSPRKRPYQKTSRSWYL